MVGIADGVFDALHGVIRGDGRGVIGAFAAQISADEGRGKDVAGTVAAPGKTLVPVIAGRIPLQYHDAGGVRRIAYAGENDSLCSAGPQACQQLRDIGLVVCLAVFRARQEAGLCDVGEDDARGGGQRFHLFYESGAKARVELSAVRHGGVGDADKALVTAQDFKHLPDKRDLLRRAEVAGVDGVEFDAFLLPVGDDAGDVLRQIAEGEAGEAAGVGGEDGGGQDGRLQPGGGEDRQRHGEGALTDAGDVLHGQDTFVRHDVPPSEKPGRLPEALVIHCPCAADIFRPRPRSEQDCFADEFDG